MRYHALACDYDGTIALDGVVGAEIVHSLQEVHKSGRSLILVTGRELPDLMETFPQIDIFDRIVAENGALLYRPATREEKVLAEAPPPKFAELLRARGAERVSIGRCIVATWSPHEILAVKLIRELGLDLQVIFNKGAVMILPSGVNKATGLTAALNELGLSFHNVVGVGDAENDHAFLAKCECSVAVANALESLKKRADWVTSRDHGWGVVELIDRLMSSDLAELEDRLSQTIVFGHGTDGGALLVRPYGTNILITGTSGGGKSTVATAFLEGLAEQDYQFLIIDPEGDYSIFEHAVVLGDEQRPPNVAEVTDLISRPGQNAVVNLVGLAFKERPAFLEDLFPRLQSLRAKTGRPHWIVIDEAHHVLPSTWDSASLTVSQRLYGLMLITLEGSRVSQTVLSAIDLVIAIGDNPDAALRDFSEAAGRGVPPTTNAALNKGEALAWSLKSNEPPFRILTEEPVSQRRRHRRKYAEGELSPGQSFYFRGPEGKLNLRAQNLTMFLQLADGVDDETWLFHLHQSHYSDWFRRVIKDPELAAEAERLEQDPNVTAEESRREIRSAVEKRYIPAA